MTSKNISNQKSSFIDSQYTFSFIIRFSGVALLGFILFALFLYLTLNRRLGVSYFEDISTLSRLQEKLPVILAVTGVIQAVTVSFILFILSLLWAHGVAGPLLRFRKSLQMAGKGFIEETVTFREKDQLHFLADSFKRMLESQKSRRTRFENLLKQADEALKEYEHLFKQKGVTPSQLDGKLTSLKKIYAEMRNLLDKGGSG